VYQVQGRRPAVLRAHIRQQCPRCPGVYGMLNARGELIYIGKAKSLRARLLSYFRPRSRDPKAGRILEHSRTIAWEPAPNEFAALLRELALIRRWRPVFNVQGQPGRRRRTFVCLGRRPAAYAFLCSRPPAGVLACFGPVPAGGRAREAARRINDWFQLRDCPQAQPMVFADQGELFPIVRAAGCIRHEIGTCLGPCAAACSRATYAERVRAAQAFLAGAEAEPLRTLERDMAAASSSLAFERAAALRDKLDALHWLHTHLERLRLARERFSFVYPVQGEDGRGLWYLIHRGHVAAVIPEPTTEDGRQSAATAIAEIYRQKHAWSGPETGEHIDQVLLVTGWFRKYPEERARVLDPLVAVERLAAVIGTPSANGTSASRRLERDL
jgi:excinuclease ABC subunit C